MRFVSSSSAMLIVAGFAFAQTPNLQPAGQQHPGVPAAVPGQQPAAANPNANRLDALLGQWEQKVKGIESLAAVLRRTDIDTVPVKKEEQWRGQLKFVRPDRADLYMQKVSNPQIYERYLCTGADLFEFLPRQKLLRVHPLPKRAPGQPVIDNTFVGFLAGMTVDEAKRRFEMTLIKEDQWYAYIEVKPRFREDAAEFSIARLALFQNTLMPREMQFVSPTGTLTKWDIDSINTNVRIALTDFATPKLPPDWQMQQVAPLGSPAAPPAQPPPSKVRPQRP